MKFVVSIANGINSNPDELGLLARLDLLVGIITGHVHFEHSDGE